MSKQILLESKKTLTALTAEALVISHQLLESGGELTPEIEARLEVNTQSLLVKVDSYVAIEDQFKMQAEYFDQKAKAFQSIAKSYKSQVDRLRTRVKEAMKALGEDTVSGNEHYYRLSKSAPKLVIDDDSKVPREFWMIVQTEKIDNEKLKSALDAGLAIPGAHIEENGTLKVYQNSKE